MKVHLTLFVCIVLLGSLCVVSLISHTPGAEPRQFAGPLYRDADGRQFYAHPIKGYVYLDGRPVTDPGDP